MPAQPNKPTYSGNLTQTSFPKLLYHLFVAQVTGRLVVNRRETNVAIWLDRGTPHLSMAHMDTDAWTKHLTQAGLLSASQLQECIHATGGVPEQLGNVLVKRNILSAEQILESLRAFFLRSVEDVFSWRDGQYAFFQEEKSKDPSWQAKFEPWPLVTEGVRKGYKKSELSSLLGPYNKWFLSQKHNPHLHIDSLRLRPEERKVFQQASRQPRLEDLLLEYAKDDQTSSTVFSMLYLGLELDLLSLAPEAGPKTTTPASPKPPTPTEETQWTDEEQALLDLQNRLKKQDYFERLGVERTCSTKQINQAFLKIAKKHHPDQLPPECSRRMRMLADQIFSLLNEAHQKLSDERFRGEYLAALEAGFQDEKVDIRNIVEAENVFKKAELLLQARNYTEALSHIEKAIQLNPDEGEFQIYRGYIMFLANPEAEAVFRRQCVEIIQAGLKSRDMRVTKGYVFLGRIENSLGNQTKAEAMYKKALELDPKDTDATRELRLLDRRKSMDKKKPKKWPWRK